MKKIFIIGCMLMGAWGTGNSENAIKMVTYFPVPYVAYSNINTSKQLDIGLVSSSVMSLGGEESAAAGLIPLNVGDTYLKTGKLDLDMAAAVLGNRILAGSAGGTAALDFEQDLRINKLNDGYSIEADQMTTDVLNLFPERISNAFPSCAATAAEGAPQVSWQQLYLKEDLETFLVCGIPDERIFCEGTKPQEGRGCGCPGGTVEKIFTCDYTTGKWVDTGEYTECSHPFPDSLLCKWKLEQCYSTKNSKWENTVEAITKFYGRGWSDVENDPVPDFPDTDPLASGGVYREQFSPSEKGTLDVAVSLTSSVRAYEQEILNEVKAERDQWAMANPEQQYVHPFYTITNPRTRYLLQNASGAYSSTEVCLYEAKCTYCTDNPYLDW